MTLIVLTKDGALHPFWSAADFWWPSAQRPWVISSQGLSVCSGKVCLQSVADGPAGIQVWDDGKMDPVTCHGIFPAKAPRVRPIKWTVCFSQSRLPTRIRTIRTRSPRAAITSQYGKGTLRRMNATYCAKPCGGWTLFFQRLESVVLSGAGFLSQRPTGAAHSMIWTPKRPRP